METIKFRASSCANLMVEPRSKSETLSETTKSYLTEVFINTHYKRYKDITNKYLTKGLLVEEDSFDLYTLHTGKVFIKNEQRFSNDYLVGTPDIIDGNCVIDIKSSWDIFTFFKSKNADLKKQYYWQLQAYMALTNTTKAKLVYCLTDTPNDVINDEKRKLSYRLSGDDLSKALDNVDKLAIYSDIPLDERVCVFDFERDDLAIERLYKRCGEANEFINETFMSHAH